MELSRSLVKDFAKVSNSSKNDKKESTNLRGTVKMVGDKKFVKLDGSDSLTPLTETVDVEADDRVLVSIENHRAVIIGNFTFPPSARKEQEALDKADDAQNTAGSAKEEATNANNLAQSAHDKADNAITQSGEASAKAEEAKESAGQAILAADNASKDAASAKESASIASGAATTAREEAEKAQQAVANAQGEIDKINKEVDSVKGDIDSTLIELENQAAEIQATKETMELQYSKKTEVSEVEASLKTEISKKVGELQTTVEENYAAKTDIVDMEGKLQTQITQNAQGITSQAQKVEKLESDTAEAQKQVDIALDKADAAQSAAVTAQNAATASQAAADSAKENATIATQKAEDAKNAAASATEIANAADQKVQSAQSDLNEAKENLANVTNRVGATEQEIADAQAKVDKAQEAVNGALADAAEANAAANKAQSAANQAQSDATQAQAEATEAQKKADNAKLAADAAQSAADKAQQDVAALTKRVVTAETKINQTAEQIELAATKVEEIGNKFDNLQIGGRNLQRNSGFTSGWDYWAYHKEQYSIDSSKKLEGVNSVKWTNATAISGSIYLFDSSRRTKISPGKTYTVSAWFYCDKVPTGIMQLQQYFYTASGGVAKNQNTNIPFVAGKWVRVHSTSEAPATADSCQIVFDLHGAGTCWLACPKTEEGNRPTAWSPAPEDTDNKIDNVANNLANNYYTKTQTDAQIKVQADRITSTVSKVETVEQTANNANNYVNNAKNNYGYQYKYDITINGDANKCYPVIFRGGNQNVMREIFIQRAYGEKAPAEWNGHPTVKGISLTLKIKCNFGGWGGAEYDWRIHDLNEMYGNLFAGAMNVMASMGYAIFLRGGGTTGAIYHIYSDQPLEVTYMGGTSPKVWYNGSNDLIGSSGESYKWYAPEPRTYTDEVIAEINSRKYIKVASDALDAANTAQNDASSALGLAESNQTQISKSMSEIQQLSDSISHLVTDEKGNTLMVQDSSGWHFNIGGIQKTLNDTAAALSGVAKDLDAAETLLNTTKNMADALEKRTASIDMTTVNGQPAIILGQSNSKFKLRITNTSIDFLDGSEAIAYISNQTLYITRAIIKDEIKIGEGTGWIVKRRPNGNLGFRWGA